MILTLATVIKIFSISAVGDIFWSNASIEVRKLIAERNRTRKYTLKRARR